MTQKSRIYEHLKLHRSITRLEAIRRYGVLNLWQRISELEESLKTRFKRERVRVKNRYGESSTVTRYSMR